jgi:hypothetical protein
LKKKNTLALNKDLEQLQAIKALNRAPDPDSQLILTRNTLVPNMVKVKKANKQFP